MAIVQTIKVQVEGTEEAAAEFKKVGDAGTEAFQQTQAAASAAGPAIAASGQQASAGLGATGKALDDTTKKAGLSRREMSALGKVMASFGGGEIAHAAVSIGRVGSALGALGVAAIGIGLAAQALAKFGGEAIKAGEAIAKVQDAGGGGFQNISNLQAAFAKIGTSAEQFGKTGVDVLAKIAEAAEKSGDAIAASTKKVDDSQLAYLKAKAAAEPYLAAIYAQHIKNAEAQQKVNQVIEAERALRAAQANELGPVIQKYQQLADGMRVVFDGSTTLATRQEALKIALKDLPLDQVLTKLARMANSMDALQKRQFKIDLKAAFPTLTDKEIAQIEKGSKAMEKFLQTPGLSKEKLDVINTVGDAWDRTVQQVQGAIGTLTIGFGEAVLGWKKIFAGDIGFGAVLAEAGNQLVSGLQALGAAIAPIIQQWVTTPVAGAWQWITDTATNAWESAKQLAGQASDALIAFVTTAPGNAWQWVVDSFNSALNGLTGAIAGASAAVVSFVTTPVANAWAWIKNTFSSVVQSLFGGSPAPASSGGSGMARGGLLGGRGTGTSDSNLAWVSRGEFIVPARAVAQPGVLAFLEALRFAGGNLRGVLNGMGRFALGGLVMPRLSVPAFAGGGMNNVTIQFPGLPEITGLRASSGVVDELRRAAAMAQVRSGGRKPSRYS